MTDPLGREPETVRRMFGRIAHRYDALNRILSFRLDRSWRRRAAGEVPADPAGLVLDLCGGTGDLALEIARQGRGGTIVCCDFSHPMLVRADIKFRRAALSERCLVVEADALRLPFAADTFDAVTVAFGVRNLNPMDEGLREILRVLRPGGQLVVLEFSRPGTGWLARLYGLYLHAVLPRIGERLSGGSGAYGYLARTVSEFPDAPTLAGRIREAGFAAVGWKRLSFGIVAVHTALKHGP